MAALCIVVTLHNIAALFNHDITPIIEADDNMWAFVLANSVFVFSALLTLRTVLVGGNEVITANHIITRQLSGYYRVEWKHVISVREVRKMNRITGIQITDRNRQSICINLSFYTNTEEIVHAVHYYATMAHMPPEASSDKDDTATDRFKPVSTRY